MKVHPSGPSRTLQVPKTNQKPQNFINIHIGTIPLRTERATFAMSGDHSDQCNMNYRVLPALNTERAEAYGTFNEPTSRKLIK